jgi:opacity protein-like surface antigen
MTSGTRKYFYLFFLFLMPVSALFAQLDARFEYGIKGTLNYTTIGSQYSKYTGSGQYGLGVFGTYRLTPAINLAFEPMITINSFRETQSDNRYRYDYFDANLNGYFNLFGNDALRLFLGVRPGFLLSYRSEVFKDGAYEKAENQQNKNKKGQIDVGVNAGLSLRVSPVINFEVGYMWSPGNETNFSQVKGRPSAIEVSLKINAVDLKNMIDRKEETTVQKIRHYHTGALLVMLPTLSEKELFKYKSESDKEFVINELRMRNMRVIIEFQKHYTFTPVYFFMDTSVNKVISGNINGIFVNANMQPDTSIMPATPENYFVASFCSDLSNYNQKVSYGLFVYDNKMTQLDKPFNIPGQLFGLFTEGDPANYFRYRKQNYVNMPFDRMIKKFNARMIRYSSIE